MPIFGSAWRLWFEQGIIVASRQSSLERVGQATQVSLFCCVLVCAEFPGYAGAVVPNTARLPRNGLDVLSHMSQAYCCLRRVANARGECALERLRRVWAWSGVVAQRKHRRAPTLTSQNIRSPAPTRLGGRHRPPHAAHAQDDTPFSSGVIQLCDVYTESVRGQTTTFRRKRERLCAGGRPCPQESKKGIRKSCNNTVRSIS